jgi:4-amino-4-deoxy-L-arabinose transferase-like glycosyltransferase
MHRQPFDCGVTSVSDTSETGTPAKLHQVLLTLLCVAVFVPLMGKAFHIDDPLFLWTARQIQSHPADFYGFKVNWYGTLQPMSVIMKNPPLAAYYLALVGSLFGWQEIALHLAFLPWAIGAVLATYHLADRFCSRPLLAALATLLTPVFLVSGSNIMCDTMMLCLWLWAMVFWCRGLDQDRPLLLAGAGVLIALCALTKYFGMCLIPLLAVYSWAQKGRPGWWLIPLFIPVVVLAAYQWTTASMYGRGLLWDAADYASVVRERAHAGLSFRLWIGLAFAGGCVSTVLFYTPLLWSRNIFLIGVLLAALLSWLALRAGAVLGLGGAPTPRGFELPWLTALQVGVFSTAGIGLLALAVVDLWTQRDAKSLLLFLWVFGTFVFAVLVNWVTNARSILPLTPAVGILLMRCLDRRLGPARPGTLVLAGWPLLPAAVLALLVSWADQAWANSARQAALTVMQRSTEQPGTLLFQGHWGFQYYMQELGASAMELSPSGLGVLRPGDIVVIPRNNCNCQRPNPAVSKLMDILRLPACSWAATMNPAAGAGFYAAYGAGPLPYQFGPVEQESYYVFMLGR